MKPSFIANEHESLRQKDAKMVVVRESPRAKHSPAKNTAQWPPQSPFQALLSSPSGRRKWQDRRNLEREVSPSPVKSRAGGGISVDEEREDEEGEEGEEGEEEEEKDDEETLKLKIQAMEAKLKLKKLQKSKKDGSLHSDGARTSSRTNSQPTSPQKASIPRPRSRGAEVEVPLSPTKDRNPPKEQQSPARARLGLNGALKAQDVSLKRARDGTQIDAPRADSRRSEALAVFDTGRKPTSFSERLARSKVESHQQDEKQERLERVRSKGFGHDRNRAATSLGGGDRVSGLSGGGATPKNATRSQPTRPSSAHQVQSSSDMSGKRAGVARSVSTRTSRPSERSRPHASGLFASRTQDSQSRQGQDVNLNTDSNSSPLDEDASNEIKQGFFDPFSDLHLSRRHIQHPDITRALSGKEIYTLPRLLQEVQAPHYDPPDCESDYVVFGILASKSNPFDQKPTHRTNDENNPQDDAFEKPRNKFMVLHLTDLKWELDLFLFGSAFDQFWKLTPGTLLAVLNPAIMPPKGNQNNGRFSLKLGSSEDCIMEIGVARDLGHCVSVKKDGSTCGTWIDKRHTEICDFHLNLMIDRERKTRMEVNTMWRGYGNDKDRERGKKGQPKSWSQEAGGSDRKNKSGGQFHREYGRLYSVPGAGGGGGGKSAASLLDAEDTDALHSMSREEASRKRIATAQRERDLARKLGEMGRGLGAEYLRAKETVSTTTGTGTRSATATAERDLFEKPSAGELGLLSKKAADEHLSPAKDRKRHFGLGALSTTTGAEALGWGGARKAGLLEPPKGSKVGSPEKGQARLEAGDRRPGIVRGRSEDGSMGSPSKKRARFALEKGIREPGRESLGEDLRKLVAGNEDGDEDELDIV